MDGELASNCCMCVVFKKMMKNWSRIPMIKMMMFSDVFGEIGPSNTHEYIMIREKKQPHLYFFQVKR